MQASSRDGIQIRFDFHLFPPMCRLPSFFSFRYRVLILLILMTACACSAQTIAENKPDHLATDWSHRHLIFSAPKTPERRAQLLSNPRYVQQSKRRKEREKGGRDDHRRNRSGGSLLHRDWNMYIGYNGNPAAMAPATAGAGNYPAKFSFNVTSAYCENPAPPAGQQPDFVVINTSLTGSATALAAIDTATVSGEPTKGQTIMITNPNLGTTLTLTAGSTTSNTGQGTGTFIRNSTNATQASNIAASINFAGNGSYAGVSAISAGNVVTVMAGNSGTSGNNILLSGNATGVSWSFQQLQNGATGTPSIVAFDNLYSGCNGSSPLPYWAYNTGGQVATSPVLSLDGTQVAFVQNTGSTATLVILKWAAHTGDVDDPMTLTTQARAAYRNCAAPCMIAMPFSTASGGAVAPDSHSSPFYDYNSDALYVGDDDGFLHEFTGVFGGNPTEVVSTSGNIWPANVDSGSALTSPVCNDGAGGFGATDTGIFVGDASGILYRVDATKGSSTNGVVSSAKLGNTGIDDGPLVDSTTGNVYVFIRGNLGSGASERASVIQFPVNFALGTAGHTTGTVSSNSTLPATAFYPGDFDNSYYNSTDGSGNMYVCSTNGGLTALWRIPVTGGSLGTPVLGPTLTTANVACSPITEFYDGTADRMFLSVAGNSVTGTNGAGAAINCSAGGGCIMSFNITSTSGWGVTTGTTATEPEPGGTSGIVIDNSSALTGASQIYFSPLAMGTCTLYWEGIGGCAIQASQSQLGSPALVAPRINLQPTNQAVPAGETATFTVVAAGSPTLNYQWQMNGMNITGANSQSYTTPPTTSANTGETFSVTVTNSVSSATSISATLAVTAALVPPSITMQPTCQTVTVGQAATFSVSATGSMPLMYQWMKNGINIGGAMSSSYTTPATVWSDGGAQFTVSVSNAAGKVTTVAAELTVNPSPAINVTTYHDDNSRSGLNSNEVVLTSTNVKSTTFGKVGFFSMDGVVDAEPLLLSNVTIPGQGVHDVVYAVSENDSVYAFDATTGQLLWHVSVQGSGESPSDDRDCGQVNPTIGITSTPVIDTTVGANGAIFLIAMSIDGSGNYYQRIHALDLTTGAELFGGPKTITATFPGTGDNSDGTNVIFDPSQYKERTGLLLLNGQIYTSWASHCDDRPYTGWFMAFNETTLAQTSVLNVTPNGYDGAIWMSGGGLAADSSGFIYALDGNGIFDTTLNANNFPSKGDFGNAFLKLSSSGGLAVADYFEMDDGVSESSNDEDLGSGGVMLLPDLTDSNNTVWHLAVGAGKDSNLYVVNRDSMGKFTSGSNQNYQFMAGVLGGGIWSVPAYFNNTVYYSPAGASILAFGITNAKLSGAPTSETTTTYTYPGALPSISANGTTNGILWAIENNDTAVLHAYDATNLGTELYNSNQAPGSRDQFGGGNKFITPMIANGRVYVATPSGVAVFGLLP
jgi:hypothetical protein